MEEGEEQRVGWGERKKGKKEKERKEGREEKGGRDYS